MVRGRGAGGGNWRKVSAVGGGIAPPARGDRVERGAGGEQG